MVIFLSLNLNGQNFKLETVKNSYGWSCIVVKSENNNVDTLNMSPFRKELLDTFISDSIIEYIYEAPLHIGYDKYIKTDTGWVWSKTSGQLSGRPGRIASMPTPELLESIGKKRELKIIGDDKVYMKIGDKETIKDCNDFKVEFEAKEREYQEWLIKENAKKQKKRRQKN